MDRIAKEQKRFEEMKKWLRKAWLPTQKVKKAKEMRRRLAKSKVVSLAEFKKWKSF